MSDEEKKEQSKNHQGDEEVSLKSQTIDLLVANVIPTTKYFESRFDFLQHQIHDLRDGQKRLEENMNQRFEQVNGEIKDFKSSVDKRFEQVDKRFEQVDKRFEQVDKRLEQIIASIDRLSDKLDRRDLDQRHFTLRMFTIAISISFLGVLGALLKIVGIF